MDRVIFNGKMVQAQQALIAGDDRGLLLGDGLFETMRAYEGRVFRARDHLDRLHRSLAEFNLRLPWSPEELHSLIQELIAANQLDSARVRLTITRGRHQGSMSLADSSSPTLLITAQPLDPGRQRAGEGLKLATARIRFSENNPLFRHKTINRLPHLWARTEAERAGADEALILDERGNVATCSTGNLFVVQYGQLFTPPLLGPVLPGVTRKVVLELARLQGIPVRDDFFAPLMLAGAEEAFMTNSVQEVVPVVRVNGRQVGGGGPGPMAVLLGRLYGELAHSARD